MQMIQISQLEAEKKKFVGPEQWSKAKFNKWLEELDGGRFKKLCPMKYSGKLFAIEDWQDFNKIAKALGGSESDGSYIFYFHSIFTSF